MMSDKLCRIDVNVSAPEFKLFLVLDFEAFKLRSF